MSNKLTRWQKFKMWTSRSFGCTSSYTIKDNDDAPKSVNGQTRKAIHPNLDSSSKDKSDDDLIDGRVSNQENKPNRREPSGSDLNQTDPNKSSLERTFSKDAEDIPFIDASVVNIPQAVK